MYSKCAFHRLFWSHSIRFHVLQYLWACLSLVWYLFSKFTSPDCFVCTIAIGADFKYPVTQLIYTATNGKILNTVSKSSPSSIPLTPDFKNSPSSSKDAFALWPYPNFRQATFPLKCKMQQITSTKNYFLYSLELLCLFSALLSHLWKPTVWWNIHPHTFS